MDVLEKVAAWLECLGICCATDSLQVSPGQVGLFPLGQEQLWRRADVVGNIRRRVRYSFLLRQVAVPGENIQQQLLFLQDAAAGQPPKLGENQSFLAQQGKLVKTAGTGLAVYELRLIAEREETV